MEKDDFRWWAEGGIRENISKVAEEFMRWRRLDPLRLLVLGPPGSGEALIGKQLAEWYHLQHISFDALLEEHRGKETAIGDALAEITAVLANPKLQGPSALSAELAVQVLSSALQQPVIRYHGYVLSGYPRNVEDIEEFLLEQPPAAPIPEPLNLEGEEAAEGEVEASPPEPPSKIMRASTQPGVVAVLHAPDDVCSGRLQVLPVEFNQRMEKWKRENPEQGHPLKELFNEKMGVEPLAFEMGAGSDDVVRVAKAIGRRFEEKVTVRNYDARRPFDEPEEADGAFEEEAPIVDEALVAQREAEEQQRKMEEEERIAQIRAEEFTLLEKHSERTRQYLMAYVVPALKDGLTDVCQERPTDPVGYLAEYLAQCAKLDKYRKTPHKSIATTSTSSSEVVARC
eukprot:NODE_9004_length_1453_cov_7.513575.p1 GENE.NODE_9004_length_1453_cov_7.513575~~NODE_9004_length_1453_cov_7.513575.p1  ORF type:complete len:459 (-),score=126.80 NODE_9004_length_1453_cov_7.513575:76-1272(-)